MDITKTPDDSMLTFIKQVGRDKNYFLICLYRCCCGNYKECLYANVSSGNTKSCGCVRTNRVKDACITHGLSGHPLYNIWTAMINRCHNENNKIYKNYGGKGIFVCNEWRNDFMAFYNWCIENGWKKRMVVDKDAKSIISGNKPFMYSPKTCSIITQKENCKYKTLHKKNIQISNPK